MERTLNRIVNEADLREGLKMRAALHEGDAVRAGRVVAIGQTL